MRLHLIRLACLVLVSVPPATAAPAGNTPAPEISYEADHLALRGYDATAYFQQGKAQRGTTAHQLHYKGATWLFLSAENLAKFKADPAAYAPQFGGHCAWATSQGYLAPGDPEQWRIVEGKLYVNFNAHAKELWEADLPDAIERGNANWPSVLTQNQDSN